MEIPAINLKAIVLVHWLLTVWGCMAWLSHSYVWGNFSVLAVGVWAIAQRDSVDAVLMFLIGMTLTILTDIIHFGIYYPAIESLGASDTFRFSAGMAILSLILKPLSCFFVYQMYRERGGDYNINFGFPTVTRNRDAYQSIDQQDQSSAAKPFNQAEDQKPAVRAY
ncbi:type-1 angiotensin II receptor-associated protein [Pygocentrus nattereri]|uniref:Angiotensin II receptor-associated protein n=1 Tax=Pygocentrus nattereri TaxID=42514 RepID=A0AAR2LJR5_PYGNA|nr:type-1 angiotensin II receptor-associated protein [Pygocentrus nattereri]